MSADPQRDDSQRLAEYTGYFQPRIRGLTGPAEQVAEVARRYGAAYRRAEQTNSAMGYMVTIRPLPMPSIPRGVWSGAWTTPLHRSGSSARSAPYWSTSETAPSLTRAPS